VSPHASLYFRMKSELGKNIDFAIHHDTISIEKSFSFKEFQRFALIYASASRAKKTCSLADGLIHSRSATVVLVKHHIVDCILIRIHP
jgi:hypothetical protein